MLALENLINAPKPPSIVSISYGQCEAENGESGNAAFNMAYQQAVAEGISIFVAAGDEGAASCDSGADAATHGIGVSGWASTPYNVAVGGTDFGDAYAGTSSSYWNASNSASFASALSYVPEIPWNDSCAGSLLAGYLNFSGTYGANSLCNSSIAKQEGLLEVTAGSGGPSGCATGTPLTEGVAGGSCQGYAKPSWQAGVPGIPNDGVRNLPDVAIFAGTGVWGHYYVTCYSDQSNGGAPCTGDPGSWAGAGGTSFGAPVMAGIQAIVNQQAGGAQGNPNYVYYRLAADPAGVCESSSGDSAVSPCIFHNITQGDIDVNCGGTQNCYGSTGARSRFVESRHSQRGRGEMSDTDGALSILGFSFVPAYGTAAGWNFATGIGSINAYNLVKSWMSGQ